MSQPVVRLFATGFQYFQEQHSCYGVTSVPAALSIFPPWISTDIILAYSKYITITVMFITVREQQMTWNMEVGFESLILSFEVFTAMLFCYTTPGRFVTIDISKKIASLASWRFKQSNKKPFDKASPFLGYLDPEDGRGNFVLNVGYYLPN